MPGKLTPASTVDNLKREAKRWLKALRGGDADSRARLARALSNAPAEPTLRDVQLALAREYGFTGWKALRTEAAAIEMRRSSNDRLAAIEHLFTACGSGDITRVIALLDTHPDILNACTAVPGHSGARTALHHAVAHADIVATLLARGADPTVRDEGDNAMPLHFAAEREDTRVIRLLLEHGADPIGADDHHELEVIGWATCFGSGRGDIVDYLIAHGARHNIFSAVAMGEVEHIRALVDASPADLDRPMDTTNHRRRPLHLAVMKKRPESLAALLEPGADTEALDAAGLTALDQAALNGEVTMAQMLLDHGCELRLPAAVALGRVADVERLLREEPECMKPGNRHGTLIVRAAERSSADVVRTLIRAGASVNVHDDTTTAVDSASRYTPLHAAGFHGNAAVAAVLLEHGADPNIRDSMYCGAPAGWADYAGYAEVRDLILTAGSIDLFQLIDYGLIDRIAASVQREPRLLDEPFREYATCQPDTDKWWPEPWHTPLVRAILTNKPEAVRVLVEHGAAVQRPSPDGRTPLQLARAAGYDEIAGLIEQHQRGDRTQERRVR